MPASTTPTDAASAAASDADTITLSIQMPLASFSDDGLRRIEAACRAERIRRAKLAIAAEEVKEKRLEQMTTPELAGIAQRLAGSIRHGTLA